MHVSTFMPSLENTGAMYSRACTLVCHVAGEMWNTVPTDQMCCCSTILAHSEDAVSACLGRRLGRGFGVDNS